MSTDTETLATPEMLEQLADDHAAAGMPLSSATFRAMAASWRTSLRELHDAQAENTRMAATLNAVAVDCAGAERLATRALNAIASITPPVRPGEGRHA